MSAPTDDRSEFAACRAAMIAERPYGVIHVELRQGAGPAESRIAELLGELGYSQTGSDLFPIEPDAALCVVTGILHRDLAYNSPMMEEPRAAELASSFLRSLGPGRWFTNGDFPLVHGRGSPKPAGSPTAWAGGSWNPLSAATFDTGVLFAGADAVAIAWVEDED